MKTTGKVTGIVSNLVTVEVNGPVSQNELCYITVGDTKLMAEVIKVAGKNAAVQVFESTRGLKNGNDVEFENKMLEAVAEVDATIADMKAQKARKYVTEFSVAKAQELFQQWVDLDKYLMIKYIDGNVKGEDEKGFIDNGNGKDIPGKITNPGYSERWKRAVAQDKGDVLRVVK